MEAPHSLSVEEVAIKYGTDPVRGLKEEEAEKRLKRQRAESTSEYRTVLKIAYEQFSSVLMLLLLLAVVISFVIGEYINAALMLVVILLNGLIGFYQDYRAEKALANIKKLTTPLVQVIRNGLTVSINSDDVVSGDVLLLQSGMIAPADVRVIEAEGLKVVEDIHTGKKEPAVKTPRPIRQDTILSSRTNMIFHGSRIVAGTGKGIVVATGDLSSLSKILSSSKKSLTKTPLQEHLAGLNILLASASIALCAAVAVIAIGRGYDYRITALTMIAMIVAAVPESL
ncbi:MAG: cation-transporting P-type ATPase, partial [Thermoplasmata archaeon]